MILNRTRKYNLPLLVAYLYVFFNVFMLPNGLYYTSLLAPFFLFNALRNRVILPFFLFSIFIVLYFLIHKSQPIIYRDYWRSNLLIFLNIVFLTNVWIYFQRASDDALNNLFKKIVYLNFILVLLALGAYLIPSVRSVFWYLIPITAGSGIIPRLKMLSSEASIYSLILSPFFLYFFFYYFLFKKLLNFSFLLLLVFPLLLSFSMGVCSGLIATVFVCFVYYRKLFFQTRHFIQIMLALFVITGIMLALYWFWKDNVVFLRLQNIVSGKDTSARGRTFESFVLAGKTLEQYHCWWTGIGPGQFKIMGKSLLLNYYKYSGNVADIRVPNACADTLIVYGIIGLIIRIGLQVWLFFKTKVQTNIFRFSLFIFLFLYQFTGSYFNNLIEWTLWILVFSKAFVLFDKYNFQEKTNETRNR